MSDQMLTGVLRAPAEPTDQIAMLQLIDRARQAADEIEALRQQLANAESDCRKRIKADRMYCMSHGDEAVQQLVAENAELRAKLDEAEARASDLEATLYQGNLEREKCQRAMILRKQAEAVEAARDEICEFRGELWNAAQPDELTDYAQHLRQQADELENNQ